MRARTITTTTRRRRRARRRLIALALGVCALATPASAGAFYLVDGDHKSAAAVSADESSGSGFSSPNAIVGPSSDSDVLLRGDGSDRGADYSSLNAITGAPAGEPTLVSSPPVSATGGFQWGDAALGAGAAMVLVALAGTVLFTVRRRPGVSPSASTS